MFTKYAGEPSRCWLSIMHPTLSYRGGMVQYTRPDPGTHSDGAPVACSLGAVQVVP